MTASERLARFVHELTLDAIPGPVREHAKLCVMDTLGIAVAATKEPAATAAVAVARRAGGTPEATLIVHGDRVPAPMAALANGTAAFSHNFTDTTLSCVIHGGPVTVPAALAVGELVGASGAQALTAVVAGYEVMMEVTFPQNWTAIMDDPTGATYAPVSYAQATNNLRFCLALGLHAGRVYLDEFDQAHLRDPAILDTARRVIPHPDATLGRVFETTDRAPTRLEVVLKDGARHVQEVDYPRGSPKNPATRAELEAKFDALVAPVLPAGRPAAIRAALSALEQAPAIGDLTGLCRA